MRFTAQRPDEIVAEYYSVGGGFVATAAELDAPIAVDETHPLPHPFRNAEELVARCRTHGLSVAELALANECARRPATTCVPSSPRSGGRCASASTAAARPTESSRAVSASSGAPPRCTGRSPRESAAPIRSSALDWVNLWALAVNEENAAGGRVVTAPTNGAAGIVPAVLHYYWHFVPGADEDGIIDFLLAAGAIGRCSR
jgi:L-serine dehydratase